MATKKTSVKKASNQVSKPQFKVLDPKDIQRGDVVYIECTDDATPYLVIDYQVGYTYILFENLNTQFAYMYHFTNLYKKL